MTESQGGLNNYGFDIYGCRHFVELFCIEEHKHFIMQYHTVCSVPLHLCNTKEDLMTAQK